MISLQIALLIAGIVVFFVVLIISYDKIGHSRLHRRAGARSGTDTHESDTETEPLLTPRTAAGEPYNPMPRYQDDNPPRSTVDEERRLKPEFLDQESPFRSVPKTEKFEPAEKKSGDIAAKPESGVSEMPDHGAGDGVQIEYVAWIPGENVIKRDSALGIYKQRDFDLSKPHRIFGLSHPTRMWCDLEKQPDSARFTDFGLTLQLADRQGSAGESELNEFSQIVLKLAEVFGRRFQFSCDFDNALKQGEYLDQIIRKYDALAILNIVARNEPFKMSDVDDAASDLGMEPNPNNVYVKYEGNRAVYRMADKEKTHGNSTASASNRSTRGLTLFMDIPRTPDPGRVFNDMVNDTKELCKRLDGKLVDENHRGMTQKGLKRIGQEIRSIAAEMEGDGITPGRECALKLF